MRYSTGLVIVLLVAGGLLYRFAPEGPAFDEPNHAEGSEETDDHGLVVIAKADSPGEPAPVSGSVTTTFRKKRDAVLRAMKRYMKAAGGEVSYDTGDIERCGELIDRYLFALDHLPEAGKQEFIQSQVKSVVLCLNDLNKSCGHVLIETDEREKLAAIIEEAALQVGFVTNKADITEEWREW